MGSLHAPSLEHPCAPRNKLASLKSDYSRVTSDYMPLLQIRTDFCLQLNTPERFSLQGQGLATTAAGAALATGGALAAATSAFAAKAGRDTARELRHSPATHGMSPARVAVTAIYTGHGIARTAAGSVLLAAGILAGEPIRLLQPVHIGYTGLSTYFGSTTLRAAMAVSSRMELHAILMLLPVITVAVQILTGVSRTQRPEYLVLGSLLLIAANILLTLRSMRRPKVRLPAAA